MDGQGLFRKDVQGDGGSLSEGSRDAQSSALAWTMGELRTCKLGSVGAIMWVLLSYCLPDWEEQMGPSADSQKQSHVCKPWSSWGTPSTQIPAGHNTAGHKGSERFLEHRDGDFLMQRVEEPAKADTLIDLIQT